MIDRNELLNRAIESYFIRFGKKSEQPNRGWSKVLKDNSNTIVVLANINGELARFKTCKHGKLRFLY